MGEAEKTKVLIVDHGSKYTAKLKQMYEEHEAHVRENEPDLPGVSYEITVVTDKEILKRKEQDEKAGKGGEWVKEYHIIHPSGSMNKSNINDEATNYLADNAHQDAHVIGSCYSAQVLATRYGAQVHRLKEYQKGKQEIEYKGRQVHIHKDHRWGIPVTSESESRLEAIATSEQTLENGKKTPIYEVFRSRQNPRHIGVQGHGEQGVGRKQVMYDLLTDVHKQRYQQPRLAA